VVMAFPTGLQALPSREGLTPPGDRRRGAPRQRYRSLSTCSILLASVRGSSPGRHDLPGFSGAAVVVCLERGGAVERAPCIAAGSNSKEGRLEVRGYLEQANRSFLLALSARAGLWKAARFTALTMPVAGTEERLQPFSAVLGLTERASHSFPLAGPCRRAPRIEPWRALCVPWRTDRAGSLLYSSRCQASMSPLLQPDVAAEWADA
jgi:hypothetical protein